MSDFRQITDFLWERAPAGGMRVPARIYATRRMFEAVASDNAPEQVVNVAHLPGIVGASLAMPDIHWGYGFAIGGVAGFDAREGIVSPGGVGYDINCGVRFLATALAREEVQPRIGDLVNGLFHSIPSGVGSSGALTASRAELQKAAVQGAAWAVGRGYGREEDLAYIEEGGCMADADPAQVSDRAWKRGQGQLGTLGSGNHFLEIAYVSEVYDENAAGVMGLFPGQVTLTVHCGSRGFGYQVCDDYLGVMDRAVKRYGIELPDRQLACAPLRSAEAQAYLGAMRCAVNYAFANRQVIAHLARETFERVLERGPADLGLRTVYEVAHNIAKFERHRVGGRELLLCVHRKGATRAFPPGHPDVPAAYREIGQPVLIPGDMGRYSYVLTGTARAMRDTLGSTCHGAGRAMSRKRAARTAGGRDIAGELRRRDIVVIGRSRRTLVEEIPEAYKDVADVVDVCVAAGISNRVARLTPMGCIKG